MTGAPHICLMRLAILVAFALAACDTAQPASAPAAVPEPVATRGLDAVTMQRVVAQARTLPRLRSLIVQRDGRPLAEHRFAGPALDRPVNIKSASKTVMSALVGIAIQRNVLSGVDQPILPVLRADAPADPDPRLARVTVEDLLTMRAGLERTSGEYYGRWVASPNWVRYALSRPFADDPGGRMLYSTGSTHLLSAMLTRAAGRSTYALAQDWLGAPLGIAIPQWTRDPQGIYFGGNEMSLSPRALARFGELYRNGGTIDGKRVLPTAWVRESWQPRATSPWSGNGYGYGWFSSVAQGHPVHFAWGYGGQMLYVVPSLKLTVVMTSDPSPHPRAETHVPALHALLSDGIVPAAIAGA